MKLNNKAYTLTELLVVVILAGILATMVLPKFANVIDSYRLMEAENVMRLVRNDQEQRCTLDKKYAQNFNQISVLAGDSSLADGASYVTSNFEYEFEFNAQSKPVGIMATDLKNNVTLEMPSFLDGRICCDNCDGLNRDYEECADLMAREDFDTVTADCLP
ncbi:MAG: type II secretion system protein [Elusimicrobiaceae bacterium]|nr:type II secretion system protein [Elusimicrobiaceae bacterium]